MAWFTSGNDEWERQQMLQGKGGNRAAYDRWRQGVSGPIQSAIQPGRTQQGQQTPQPTQLPLQGQFQNLMQQMQNLSRNFQGSYLPAAGQVIAGGMNSPSPQALNRPQQDYGTPAGGAPRLGRDDLTTYQTPSGGFATVKRGSTRIPQGSQLYQSGNQVPINYAAEVAKGFGSPNPSIQDGYLVGGGVANPVENLSPQQSQQFGLPTNPIQRMAQSYFPGISSLYSAALGFGSALGSLYNQRNKQDQYAYNPQYQLPPAPRRYSDYY